MQRQYAENLSVLPDFNYARHSFSPWELPHLQTFMSWGQSAVRQSMELQTHWLEQWSNQMGMTVTSSNQSKEDLVSRIQESMSAWADNQGELWQYWFKMIDETAGAMEDPESLNEHINYWKSTVEESLNAQSDWLENWTNEVDIEELSPNELIKLSSSVQETMQGWLDLQTELWNQWFRFLSLSDEEKAATPAPAAKKAAPKPAAARPAASSKASSDEDDLQTINGIGPTLAKKLYQQGITSFKQIAELTEDQIDTLEETIIRFPGRIRRENWVTQAMELVQKSLK